MIVTDRHVTRCGNCGGWTIRLYGCRLCAADTTLTPKKGNANQ